MEAADNSLTVADSAGLGVDDLFAPAPVQAAGLHPALQHGAVQADPAAQYLRAAVPVVAAVAGAGEDVAEVGETGGFPGQGVPVHTEL